ncbi:MAG: hypothetical protein WCD56_14910, partial [Pseudolabrys sp.]
GAFSVLACMLPPAAFGANPRLQNSALNKGKQQLIFLLHIPAGLELEQLKSEIRDAARGR